MECPKKYRELIRILLSLSFASRESLGWDTIDKLELEKDDNRRCDNVIAGEYHHIDETYLISYDISNTLMGSNTRVLCSCEGIEDCGKRFTTEDYHFDEERKTEDGTNQVIEDINVSYKKEYLKELTLDVLAAERGNVCYTDESTRDATLCGRSPDMYSLYEF